MSHRFVLEFGVWAFEERTVSKPIDQRWLLQQAAMNQQLLALPQQLVFRDLLTIAGCRDKRSIGWLRLVGPAQDATISFRSLGAKCVGGALEPCATE